MCEVLLRVKDPDLPLATKHLRLNAGDAVSICPDGWGWTQAELTAPYWRIVRLTGVPVAQLEDLLAPETGDPLVNQRLRRRGKGVDITSQNLPKVARDWLADDSRAQPIFVVPETTFRAAVFQKVLLPNLDTL